MNDGPLRRQTLEQARECFGRWLVPGALQCGGDARWVAKQIALAKADHLDACGRECLVDRTRGRENDWAVTGLFQPDGAVERDLGLPA